MATDFGLFSRNEDDKLTSLYLNGYFAVLSFVGAKWERIEVAFVRDGIVLSYAVQDQVSGPGEQGV